MASKRDIVIIGGGHNGLVTAFYLAKAGYKPLILEAREQIGGCAVTEEIAPGFRCSTLSHSSGPIRADIMRDMRLESHGLKTARPKDGLRLFAPDPNGRALFIYDDAKKSSESIAALSKKDAEQFPEFQRVLAKLGKVTSPLMAMTPPSVDSPSGSDVINVLKAGKAIRGLGKHDLYRLLRWGPMAIADFVAEWFESELLRATIAARGIFGTFLGPWSAGSATVMLMRAAADAHPVGPTATVIGGVGALTQAMASAAQKAGAEIRTNAQVVQINTKAGSVIGVTLANGEEIAADKVISNADPKRTLLSLLDPGQLEPDFVLKLRNTRAVGTVAKVNLALSGLPKFAADHGEGTLAARIHIGPEIDYLERAFDHAKYGEFSTKPYLEATIPSLLDNTLAPAGKHVMSIYMQFAPYKLKNGAWDSQRNGLADVVIKTLAEYAPNLPQLVEHTQVITPQDLESRYGLTGGHIFHSELALDQLFTMRPLLEWAKYRTPITGLYLCGSGTHPGAGLTGSSGANAAREILHDLK
jgi:phytoene dehydrogenase-like protein